MDHFGYHGKILHLDLAREETRVEEPPESLWRITGGTGILAAKLLLEHTRAGIDPLGPDNLLVFANSVVSGYHLPGLARHVVCAKSPFTGGIGETRVEGPFSADLKRSGFDALVFHGAASRPTGVLIEDGVASFFDASDLRGLTTNEAADRLEARFGEGVGIAAIGPAGENLVRFAAIVSHRTHQAQRMGMGAVMGGVAHAGTALFNFSQWRGALFKFCSKILITLRPRDSEAGGRGSAKLARHRGNTGTGRTARPDRPLLRRSPRGRSWRPASGA